MGILEIIGGALLIVFCVIIIAAVTAQESKGGLGAAISGDSSSGTFFDKNRGKTKEAMLVRATTVSGIAMVIVTLVVLFVSIK